MKRRMKDADEYDAFTKWRRVYHWRAGALKAIKRRANKRERQEAKRIEDMCCICLCGHRHPVSPLPLPVGQWRQECVACKWCICTASEHATMPD